jgi:hypothetical protein
MGEEFEFSNRCADLYRAYRPLLRRILKNTSQMMRARCWQER